jgi:hypothetical protein
MELTNTREILHVRDADLTCSRFSNAKMTNAQFDGVHRFHYPHSRSAGSQGSSTGKTGV